MKLADTKHPIDDLVTAAGRGELGASLLAHLEICASCRELHDDLIDLARSDSRACAMQPRDDYVANAGRVATTRDREEGDAAAWLARYEGPADPSIHGALARFGEGGVQAILSHAREMFQKDPATALKWTDLALDLLSRVDLGIHPEAAFAQLMGEAWKDRANALRLLGRYDEALAAIGEASEEFDALVVSEPWLAMADYVRGTIVREMDRYDEALRLAQSSAAVFERYGYEDRLRHARVLEASTRYRLGDYRGARATYSELLEDATDPEEIADLHNNLGSACVELGEFEEAAKHYHDALPLFRELGWRVAEIRLRWGIARMLLFQGRATDALGWLRDIQEMFGAMEMTEEAALVGLDIVEGLVVADLPGARDLSRELVDYFARRRETPSLARAFAYLRESMERSEVTADTIRSVRHRIRESAPNRLHAIVPPPDLE